MIGKISFCILSYGHPSELLKKCLESIYALNVPGYEILVVGTTGNEAGVRYFGDVECPREGFLNTMRNYICDKATNEFIVLADADVEFFPDWYSKMKDADFYDIIGSRLVTADNKRAVDWGYLLRLGDGTFVYPLKYDEWTTKAFVSASLMTIRKVVWESVKFDEGLSGDGEIDFCLRAAKTGYRVGVIDDAAAKCLFARASFARKEYITFDEPLRIAGEYKEAFAAGMDAFKRGDYNRSIRYFEKSLKVAPNEPNACVRMGWANYYMARYNEALKAFDKALIHDKADNSALMGRGWAYLHKLEYGRAIENFLSAVESVKPGDKDGFVKSFRGLCWSYYHRGSYSEAVENFKRLLEKTDKNDRDILQDIYRGIGWTYYKCGRYNEAAHSFENAIKNIDIGNKYLRRDALKGLKLSLKAKSGSYAKDVKIAKVYAGASAVRGRTSGLRKFASRVKRKIKKLIS